MRISIFLLFLLSLIVSCKPGTKKVVYEHPEGYFREVYHVINDSVKHGSYYKYMANGTLVDSSFYENGLLHGTRKIYAPDGYLIITESYVMGDFEGPYKTYYPSGPVKKWQQYQQNKIQGEVKEFYEDGTLKAIVQFVDNLENGPFIEYYPNGKVHWEGFYQGGDFEQDTLNEFDEEGMLLRKLYCDQGICQTIWTPEKGYFEPEKIFGE